MVLQDLSVIPTVDGQANHLFCVAECSFSKKKIVKSDVMLLEPLNCDAAIKLMQTDLRDIQIAGPLQGLELFWEFLYGLGVGELLFEVALAVQIGSLHVAHGILLGGVEEEQVCWDDLCVLDLHKVTGADVLPLHLLEDPFPEHMGPARVDFVVPYVSFLSLSGRTMS